MVQRIDTDGTWSVCQQGVTLSKCGMKIDRLTDVANTLLARDFKSFGNQSMNGVIEYEC